MKDMESRRRTVEPFDEETFRRGDALLQPAYAWVWNAPVNRENVARRLDDMARLSSRDGPFRT